MTDFCAFVESQSSDSDTVQLLLLHRITVKRILHDVNNPCKLL